MFWLSNAICMLSVSLPVTGLFFDNRSAKKDKTKIDRSYTLPRMNNLWPALLLTLFSTHDSDLSVGSWFKIGDSTYNHRRTRIAANAGISFSILSTLNLVIRQSNCNWQWTAGSFSHRAVRQKNNELVHWWRLSLLSKIRWLCRYKYFWFFRRFWRANIRWSIQPRNWYRCTV